MTHLLKADIDFRLSVGSNEQPVMAVQLVHRVALPDGRRELRALRAMVMRELALAWCAPERREGWRPPGVAKEPGI